MQQETSDKPFNYISPPDILTLKRLAISESGFIFDPESGHSFSVNETGMFILQALQKNQSPEEILQAIVDTYEISLRDAERDLIEYVGLLRKQLQGTQQ